MTSMSDDDSTSADSGQVLDYTLMTVTTRIGFEYSVKYSVTIRFDDLDLSSNDLEQVFDDLD